MYLTHGNIHNTKLGRAKYPQWHFVKDAQGSRTTSEDVASALKVVGSEWCFQLTQTMYWTGFVKLKEPMNFGEMQRIMHWDYLRQSQMTDQESWVHCSREEWRLEGPWVNNMDESTDIYEDEDENVLEKTVEHESPLKVDPPPKMAAIMINIMEDTESTVEHYSTDSTDEEMLEQGFNDLESIEEEMREFLPNYYNAIVLDMDLNLPIQ